MTFAEFMAKVLAAFPEAEVGEDNDGQLVVYTNLKLDSTRVRGDRNAPEVSPFRVTGFEVHHLIP